MIAGVGENVKKNRFFALTQVGRPLLRHYSTLAFLLTNIDTVEYWVKDVVDLLKGAKDDEDDGTPPLLPADDGEDDVPACSGAEVVGGGRGG